MAQNKWFTREKKEIFNKKWKRKLSKDLWKVIPNLDKTLNKENMTGNPGNPEERTSNQRWKIRFLLINDCSGIN